MATLPPMINAMVKAKINTSGARTAIRIIIIKACCTLLISVVRRVTSEELENSSMLAKLNVWIL